MSKHKHQRKSQRPVGLSKKELRKILTQYRVQMKEK